MESLSGREKQIVSERLKKVEELRKEGINPYPNRFVLLEEVVHSNGIKKDFSKLRAVSVSKDKRVDAGRVITKRTLRSSNYSDLLIQEILLELMVLLQRQRLEKCLSSSMSSTFFLSLSCPFQISIRV